MDSKYLKLNTTKTQLKIFNPYHNNIPFQINYLGEIIDPIDEITILGIRLTNNLDLNAFILKKVRACNLQLRNLNHIRDSLPFKTRLTLITNTIISHLDYCNCILSCATQTSLRPLQLILNRGVRFIFGISKFTHITPYLLKLHILPIRYRIIFKLCLIAFKIFYRKAPNYLQMRFQIFRRNPNLNLRDGTGRDEFMFTMQVPPHKKETIYFKIKKNME